MTEPDFDSLSPDEICGRLVPFFRYMLLDGTLAKLPDLHQNGKSYTEIPAINMPNCHESVMRRITKSARAAGYKVIRVNSERWGSEEREGYYFLFDLPKDHEQLVLEYARQRSTLLGRTDSPGASTAQERLTRYLMYKWDQIANPPSSAGRQTNEHVVMSAGGVDTFYIDSRRGTVDELDHDGGAEKYYKQNCCYVRLTSGEERYSVSYKPLVTRWEIAMFN